MTTFGQTLLTTASAMALMLAGAISTPANAGDWNNGASGLKGSYASKIKAVPAPAPIPEYDATYYIGIHGNFTAASSGTITAESDDLELRSMSETANFLSGGFSIGRYITPSIRAEISLDLRPVRGTGNATYSTSEFRTTDGADRTFTDGAGATIAVQTIDEHEIRTNRKEITEYQYQTGMVNFYKDFQNGSRFTPFLGAGIGAVLYTFKNKSSLGESCYQTTNLATNPFTNLPANTAYTTQDGAPACRNEPEDLQTEEANGGTTANSWGLALAGTAGIAIDVSESMKFDLAYRALYTSGNTEIEQLTRSGSRTTVKVEDRLDHELRLGLRWDIN